MNRLRTAVILVFALGAVFAISACNDGGSGGSGGSGGGGGGTNPLAYFRVKVQPANPGWTAEVIPPTLVDPVVRYPGVNADRLNPEMTVQVTALNDEATILALEIRSDSEAALPRNWLLIHSVDANARLFSPPDAENGVTDQFLRGEPLFVFGPLAPGGSATVVLTFKRLKPDLGYEFSFDLLAIPDRIVFSSKQGDSDFYNLYTAQPDGGRPFQVAALEHDCINAVFAPGGERIAFAVLDEFYQVYTVHPDGSHLTQITDFTNHAHWPSFSPDGKTLLYSCYSRTPNAKEDVCLNDVTGGNERVLVNNFESVAALLPKYAASGWFDKRVFNPSWSPDGTRVVYLVRHPVSYARYYYILQNLDPFTYARVGNPIILNRPWDQLYYASSKIWMTPNSTFNWSPDGSHAAFSALRYASAAAPGRCFHPSCAPSIPVANRFYCNFVGPWILDLEALLTDPRAGETIGPFLGDYAVGAINGQRAANSSESMYLFPAFGDGGAQLLFEKMWDGVEKDLVYLPLDAAFTPTDTVPATIIANGSANAGVTWMRELLPGFYR